MTKDTTTSTKNTSSFNPPKKLDKRKLEIAKIILKEVKARLEFLNNVGLKYLSLNRSSETLSGGEAQRIRLATQIGSGLTGVLYILDEPSIGLHQRDNSKLLATLDRLKELGNTIIVVEHDVDTWKAADILVDIGPKAGKHGGKVISVGTPEEITVDPNSPSGSFLSNRDSIAIPKKRRKVNLGSHASIDYEAEVKKIKSKWLNEVLESCNL